MEPTSIILLAILVAGKATDAIRTPASANRWIFCAIAVVALLLSLLNPSLIWTSVEVLKRNRNAYLLCILLISSLSAVAASLILIPFDRPIWRTLSNISILGSVACIVVIVFRF